MTWQARRAERPMTARCAMAPRLAAGFFNVLLLKRIQPLRLVRGQKFTGSFALPPRLRPPRRRIGSPVIKRRVRIRCLRQRSATFAPIRSSLLLHSSVLSRPDSNNSGGNYPLQAKLSRHTAAPDYRGAATLLSDRCGSPSGARTPMLS